MILSKRFAIAPALAVAFAGMSVSSAQATTEPLSDDAVRALAVASCQLEPLTPLTLEEMDPAVVATADVEVVPGEITAHLVRAQVTTSVETGDVQECTFGVLHRDALLPQVQHLGTVSLDRVDTLAGTSYGAVTEIELGNMGKSSPVDPTTEVVLDGFLTPLENAVEDPTYTISLVRKSIQDVQIGPSKSQVDAAARVMKAETKAADQRLKKQTKAAKGKHADKVLAAAQRAYDKRIAAAQARYTRATTPKTVSRPVSVTLPPVTGTVAPPADVA